MNTLTSILKSAGVVVAGVFAWFGDLPSAVRILLIVMTLDFVAGIAQALHSRTLSSRIAWNGISKKVVTLAVVAMAYFVSDAISGPALSAPIGQAVAGFYVAAESLSVLEKADAIGIPIPDFLKSALNQLDADKNKV